MLKNIGDKLYKSGILFEKLAGNVGVKAIQPAVAAYRPAKYDFMTETQNWLYDKNQAAAKPDAVTVIPKNFVAQNANIDKESVVMDDNSGIWYGSTVKGQVSIGRGSQVLEQVEISGSKGEPVVIGSGVIIYPGVKIGAGVNIGDNSVIKSGSVIEEGVTIEESSVIVQGSVVTKGSKIGQGEIWAGNPAVLNKDIDVSISNLSNVQEAFSKQAIYHEIENSKDIFEKHYERQALKDRRNWAEDVIEDHENSPQGYLPIYLNIDHFPDPNPERRGLIYNKGEDKGPEGNPRPAWADRVTDTK